MNDGDTKHATIADVAGARRGLGAHRLAGAHRRRPRQPGEAGARRGGDRRAELPAERRRPGARSRKPQVIAVIAGDTSRYGYAETIRGIEEAARADGYTVMITVVETADDDEIDQAISATLAQPLAGVVVLKFDPPGVAALQRIPDDLPLVALSGVRETGLPAGGARRDPRRRGADRSYLLGLGHTTVHHVRVPPSRREDGRTTGWRRALRKAGAADPASRSTPPGSRRADVQIGRRLADRPERHGGVLRQRRDRDGRHPRARRGGPLGARATSRSSDSTTTRSPSCGRRRSPPSTRTSPASAGADSNCSAHAIGGDR